MWPCGRSSRHALSFDIGASAVNFRRAALRCSLLGIFPLEAARQSRVEAVAERVMPVIPQACRVLTLLGTGRFLIDLLTRRSGLLNQRYLLFTGQRRGRLEAVAATLRVSWFAVRACVRDQTETS